jgi:hypothetical protein
MKQPIPIYSTRNRRRTRHQPVEVWVLWLLAVTASTSIIAWVVTTIVMNIKEVIK